MHAHQTQAPTHMRTHMQAVGLCVWRLCEASWAHSRRCLRVWRYCQRPDAPPARMALHAWFSRSTRGSRPPAAAAPTPPPQVSAASGDQHVLPALAPVRRLLHHFVLDVFQRLWQLPVLDMGRQQEEKALDDEADDDDGPIHQRLMPLGERHHRGRVLRCGPSGAEAKGVCEGGVRMAWPEGREGGLDMYVQQRPCHPSSMQAGPTPPTQTTVTYRTHALLIRS